MVSMVMYFNTREGSEKGMKTHLKRLRSRYFQKKTLKPSHWKLNNWKKLGRLVDYLEHTVSEKRMIGASGLLVLEIRKRVMKKEAQGARKKGILHVLMQ